MRNRKAVFNLLGGIMILLVGCQVGMLLASDKPEETRNEVTRAEAGAGEAGVRNDAEASSATSATPASMASILDEMREQISIQRKQIDKLQSALEQQPRRSHLGQRQQRKPFRRGGGGR